MKGRRDGLAVRVLGYPHVRWAGEALKLPTQKSLALLCYLAMRDQAVPRDELAELLWPPEAAANLRPELHRLRRLPGASAWLEVGATVVVRAETDLAAFERAVYEERYREALAYYPPNEVLLHGLTPKAAPAFADWLELERQRVSSLLRDALHGQSLMLEQAGAFAEALSFIRQLIALDPLDESAYRAAMRCEVQRGQVEAALDYFEACRRALKEELDVEPLSETLALAREIERGQALPGPHVGVPRRRIPKGLLHPPLLVGREREWARLEAAWEAGQSINVSGPPGVGKTRLMVDFARAKGSHFILEGRPGDRVVPYSTLARALREALERYATLEAEAEPWVKRELARILPDAFRDVPLGPQQAETVPPEGETRFFEAVVQLMGLLRRRVGAILVDDLQYLDARSFEVGIGAQARLLTEGGDPRYARLVAAFRTGELPEAFEQGLALAVDYGMAVHVVLEPLDEAAVKAMLQSLDVDRAEQLAPRLQRLTGGNPQFVVEMLKHAYETGAIDDLLAERIELPDKVAALMKERLNGLSPLAFRLSQAAAVLNQPAKLEVLTQVLGTSAFDVADALTELERAQVFKGGAFIHDLLAETVVKSMPDATRALLNRRSAAALERAEADPVRVAHHWQQAGEGERAAKHRLAAARRYQTAGLQRDALRLLEEVLACATDEDLRQEAILIQARVLIDLARYQEARNWLAPLLDRALSPLAEAQALELMALAAMSDGRLHEAEELAVKGLEKGEAVGDEPLKQRLTLLRARVTHRFERHQEALAWLEPLRVALERDAPSLLYVAVLSELGAVYDNLGRSEEALPLHYQALEHARRLGSPHHQVIAAGHLVYCLLELGRPLEALAPGEAALALGRYRTSDLLRIHLARAYLALERWSDAAAHCRHLCEQSTDPALRAAAWARLAEVSHHTGRRRETLGALEQALAGLEQTDFARAHARVAVAVLRYGNDEQKEQLEPYLRALDLEVLPPYLKDDLEELVE